MEYIIVFWISPLFFSIVSFLVGYFLIQRFVVSFNRNWLLLGSFLIGMFLFNIVFSLVATKGVTVQICFIPLVLVMYLVHRKKEKNESINDAPVGRNLAVVAGLTSFWSFFYVICYFPYLTDSAVEQVMYSDIYFYVRVLESVWFSGNENVVTGLNYYSAFEGGTSAYHYFELYQTLLLSKTFQVSSLWSFLVSTSVVFSSAASLTVLGIIRSIGNSHRSFVKYALGILLLFGAGFNLMPFSYIEKGAYSLNIMNHVTSKYMMILIFILLSSIAVYKKKYVLAVATLSFLQVLTYMMVPVVLWTSIVGGIILFTAKRISGKELFALIGITFSTTLTIHLFYMSTSISPEYQMLGVNYAEVALSFLNNIPSFVKKIAGTHIYYSLDYLIFLIPTAIILWRDKLLLSQNIEALVFFVLFFEGAIISTWILYDFHEEGWQIQYFTLCIGSVALLIWFYLISRNTMNAFIGKVAPILIILVCLINVGKTVTNYYSFNDERVENYDVSSKFYERCKTIFSNKGYVNVGFIGANPRKPTVYPVGNFLINCNSKINLECIDLSILNSNSTTYTTCSFYDYVKSQQDRNADNEKMQMEFIKSSDIDYLVGYETLNSQSVLFNESSEILKDEKSGVFIRKMNN